MLSGKCCIKSNCTLALATLVVVGTIILVCFFGYLWYKNNYPDGQLNQLISSVPGAGSEFWPYSHLIFYGILGFVFPRCDAIVIGIGAVWELIEHLLGESVPPIEQYVNGELVNTQWWYGSVMDIAINIVGFYIGKSFRLLFGPFSCKCHK